MTGAQILQLALAIAGGISVIGGAGAMIARWMSPAFRLVGRVKALEEHDRRDCDFINDIRDTNRVLCKGIMVLLDHAATGNGIDAIKKAKTEIQEHLIGKN